MLRWVLLAGLLLGVGRGGAHAEEPAYAGSWMLQLGPRTLMVLSLQPGAAAGLPVTGTLRRPEHFSTHGSARFSRVRGPVIEEAIVASSVVGDALEVTVAKAGDATDRDVYVFRLKDANDAEWSVKGWGLPPMHLVRAKGAVAVTTEWDADRTYTTEDGLPSNAEMQRIFEEDQKDREPGFGIDWAMVNRRDVARRAAVRKLLAAGALHTGEDFNDAAFVFQHGESPQDYLLAHTLAMVAVRKGDNDAIWIACATLDRYLQRIKQPQIYGTQFLTPKDKPTTQEPYERDLVSDALRKELDVPMMTEQDEQRKGYDRQRAQVQ